MAEQIKFNVWDKFEGRMILWEEMIQNSSNEQLLIEGLLNSERYLPLLYIGEEDKNGKEIYVGDILRCTDHPFHYNAPISWYGNGFWIKGDDDWLYLPNKEHREIIRNIYQNSDKK